MSNHRLILLVLAAAAMLTGCEKKNPEIPKPSLDRMQTIYTTYLKVTDSLNRPPKDLDEFKRGLPSNVDATDLLTSPHDGKPYKFVWGINPRVPPSSGFPQVFCYEEEGSGGMFDAVTVMGVVRCTAEDLAKFKAATPGAK